MTTNAYRWATGGAAIHSLQENDVTSDSLPYAPDLVRRRDPHEPEFLQAVEGVMRSVLPFIQANPRYAAHGLIERLIEPERVIQLRVCWVDDRGETRVNRAWRVQHNCAVGPFKGGMRLGAGVNLSVLKFLAFAQTFKNALTTLPLGGAKGGADFDPRGRSEGEVMRFCQSLVAGLYRHIGPDTDVLAGDMGVGARELGFMAGMMKKLSNSAACAFTGKGIAYGGSLLRPQATGYGLVYFTQQMLSRTGQSIEGKKVAVSGSGNVAQYAAEKAIALGARVLTMSYSGGSVIDPDGFTREKLEVLMRIKNEDAGRVETYAARMKLRFEAGMRPWHVPVDIALPCAVENELDAGDAARLLKNGVTCVAEGANMPCTLEAVQAFQDARILYAPGKASNAGGVAVSGLEMSQDATYLPWSAAQVDERLRGIIGAIHDTCVLRGGRDDGSVSYEDGANIAGFVKVADAMLAQGLI